MITTPDVTRSESVDVLFVVPPVTRFLRRSAWSFPLGLGYLAAVLKKHHIKTAIYNADYFDEGDDRRRLSLSQRIVRSVSKRLSKLRGPVNQAVDMARQWPRFQSYVEDPTHGYWQEVRAVLERLQPRIVGISSKVVDIPSTMKVAQLAKEVIPDVSVVVGGPSATTCGEYVMTSPAVDFLVHGEGEETFLELARQVLDQPDTMQAGGIRGLAYRDGRHTVQRTPPRPLIRDIDVLPFPDRDCLFYADADGRQHYYVRADDVITSRGCPFPCRFCAGHVAWGGKQPRMRSVHNVLAELEHLQIAYQQRELVFWDDLFTVNRQRVREFCTEVLARRWDISWVCMAHLKTLDAELLALMKAAGCREVQVGVESGNDRVLSHIRKGITTALVREKTALIRQSGLKWRAFFIIGFPTETETEMRDTLRLIEEIQPTFSQVSIFCPYPGTSFHEQLLREGRLGERFMQSDVWYPCNNYTGTMSDEQFQQFAFRAFEEVPL